MLHGPQRSLQLSLRDRSARLFFSGFVAISRFMPAVQLTDAVTCESVAVELDEVSHIEAIASEPATVTRLTFEDGQVRLVHETVAEIMALTRIAVKHSAPTAALH
jgi:hypothetical protein